MSIFKCKMCGGTLEINNETVAVCQYCGTKQTLPKLDDDRKANLYDRANHFRRNNEFDKAMGIYEQILNEDNSDCEAYWSLVLCRYGIEYVDDPVSHKRIPTVNRAQFTSIFDDEDYKSALKYADGLQKEVYEQEAIAINEIQKGILAISQKEEPFDVFICYKETDANGRRTPDSVLATELYHELTRDGFKVFFARITLEDKLGSAYEPYIFAALNSSKVMVVLGTRPEHFNAVWVKNEWSRYLALIKNGTRKMLIPAYKDMDPYDLPEEFSHLQAQDMSKLGFMQDLIRGIKKIIGDNAGKSQARETVVLSESVSANVTALLKRGYMALEDCEWDKADDFFEQALNQNAELAEAYLGKLMAELNVKTREALKNCEKSFTDNSNYQKAMRFADNNLKTFLSNTLFEKIYIQACNRMALNSITGYREAMQLFDQISGYKDAAALANECEIKAEDVRKEEIYNRACDVLNDTHTWVGKKTDIKAHEEAIVQFQSLDGWRDSNEKILICQKRIENIKAQLEEQRLAEEKAKLEKEKQAELDHIEKEKKKKRNKRILALTIPAVCVSIAFAIVLITVIIPTQRRKHFITKYSAAYEKFGVVEKGGCITFGSFEQDGVAENGAEDVEWLILDVKDDKALVITKNILARDRYHHSSKNVTWKTCSIREWLNTKFVGSAFTEEDKTIICDTTISYSNDPVYNTDTYYQTTDKVFLLSVSEANQYFNSNQERLCKPTTHSAIINASENNQGYWWWLRTSGEFQYTASIVLEDGAVCESGYNVYYVYSGIRPAMWIDLSKIK